MAVGVAHSKALSAPAPVALCVGVGHKAINFELRVWAAKFDEAESLRSELAIAVHASLRGAGHGSPGGRWISSFENVADVSSGLLTGGPLGQQ